MKKTDFSKAVTSYLAEYLPQTCGFSDNTINSYRDAFKLLLLFLQEEKGIEAHKIELKMIGRQIVSEFLDWLENTRNASVSTRNQRLSVFVSILLRNRNHFKHCHASASQFKKALRASLS